MKYAVLEVDGKQFKVAEGDIFFVDKFALNKDKGEVTFDKVLLTSDKDLQVGTPYIENMEVVCEIGNKVKTEKVIAETYKAKSRYHRKIGLKKTYLPLTVKFIGVKGTNVKTPVTLKDETAEKPKAKRATKKKTVK